MAKIMNHHNATCLSCGVVKELMLRVGPFVFCDPCFSSEFKKEIKETPNIAEIDSKSAVYRKWLKVYTEMVSL